jgi:hypothetical protein
MQRPSTCTWRSCNRINLRRARSCKQPKISFCSSRTLLHSRRLVDICQSRCWKRYWSRGLKGKMMICKRRWIMLNRNLRRILMENSKGTTNSYSRMSIPALREPRRRCWARS